MLVFDFGEVQCFCYPLVSSVLVCYPDLMSPNWFMTKEQWYTFVAFIRHSRNLHNYRNLSVNSPDKTMILMGIISQTILHFAYELRSSWPISRVQGSSCIEVYIVLKSS